jgi:RNA 3'-phosphate cyclase
MIDVDGSQGEGGGQMLRTALALSALTGQEVRVQGIRAERPNPGLQAQHLCAVEGVARVCGARVVGGALGSTELTFSPGKVKAGRFHLGVGTAGSVTLVLQACLLACARCDEPALFEVTGGTNVRWSPPLDFYRDALFRMLGRMGASAEIEECTRGFYPEGGGRARVRWRAPASYAPLQLDDRGELRRIEGRVFTQNLPEHVARRMGDAVRKAFLGEDLSLRMERSQGLSTGAGAFLLAEYKYSLLSGDGLGERGAPAERVGEAAALALRAEMSSAATLDAHAADQLLPYMALAEGRSRCLVREVTGHLAAQAEMVRLFLGASVRFDPVEGGTKVEVVPGLSP